MKTRPIYRIVAVCWLLAYCFVVTIKTVHRHEAFIVPVQQCVIDGKEISTNHPHKHQSVSTEYKTQTENCVICQYNLSKTYSANTLTEQEPSFYCKIINSYYLASLSKVKFSLLPTRAPPEVV
ncbi:MAG: hypothetical protein IJS73_07970 [Paludibacteraceae bacterium]|nr:hypothetical protein [Paludibacteraceae bacterium]